MKDTRERKRPAFQSTEVIVLHGCGIYDACPCWPFELNFFNSLCRMKILLSPLPAAAALRHEARSEERKVLALYQDWKKKATSTPLLGAPSVGFGSARSPALHQKYSNH